MNPTVRRSRWSRLATWGAPAIALAFLARTLWTMDLGRVVELIGRSGGWIALGLLPYPLALFVDAVAWRTLLGPMARPPLLGLMRVRLRCDSLGATLPGGTLVGESMGPAWLAEAMPLEAGVAAIAGRKCMVGLAEGLYVLLSFALGFAVLHARSAAMPWVVLGLAAFLLAMFGALTASLASGHVARRLFTLLGAVPVPLLRQWADARRDGFGATDVRLASLLGASPARLARACAISLGAWLVESLEAWLLLRLVGVSLPITTVLAFEASVSLLRSLGSFSPGGLGIQDVGYVAALSALGVPDAVTSGGAFLVLKRGRELAWALLGFATMVPRPGSAGTRATTTLASQLGRTSAATAALAGRAGS